MHIIIDSAVKIKYKWYIYVLASLRTCTRMLPVFLYQHPIPYNTHCSSSGQSHATRKSTYRTCFEIQVNSCQDAHTAFPHRHVQTSVQHTEGTAESRRSHQCPIDGMVTCCESHQYQTICPSLYQYKVLCCVLSVDWYMYFHIDLHDVSEISSSPDFKWSVIIILTHLLM
jgi:hypothetical protein